jgi:acyl transferase domain-containing protein
VAPGSLRRAAISSFGFSGTNAHLVIEEYPLTEHAVPSRENDSFIVPLSARTEEQLRQRARDLLKFLTTAQPVDLADLAYTLQIGRDAMEERVGFLVSSVKQLVTKLSGYIDGERNMGDVYQGRLEAGNESVNLIGQDDDMQGAIDKWIERRKLPKLLDLWVRGLTFDWNKLYDDTKPRRISLPTYPFAREHYWIDEMPVSRGLDAGFEVVGNMRSIEEIIDHIGDDMMETEDGVKALKMLV